MKKQTIAILSRLFPKLIVNLAYKQLNNPQVKKNRPHELAILETAHPSTLEFSGFNIRTYQWGQGEETVLLVHGWEGQAGNFADLVEPLVARGYRVLAFDAPAHGFSTHKPTSLFDFTSLVGKMLKDHQPAKVISHSFGGVAVTYALANDPSLSVEKYVLLTTPDKFSERIDYVAEQTGISKRVKQDLMQKVERETGLKIDTLSVSKFVGKAKVAAALILHDTADKVISVEQSRNVNRQWEQSELQELSGTGHYRLLRSPEAIEAVVQFFGRSN